MGIVMLQDWYPRRCLGSLASTRGSLASRCRRLLIEKLDDVPLKSLVVCVLKHRWPHLTPSTTPSAQ